MPRGSPRECAGKLTLNSDPLGGRFARIFSITRTACWAAWGKSKCSESSSDIAMLVILKKAPSIAAATVPNRAR